MTPVKSGTKSSSDASEIQVLTMTKERFPHTAEFYRHEETAAWINHFCKPKGQTADGIVNKKKNSCFVTSSGMQSHITASHANTSDQIHTQSRCLVTEALNKFTVTEPFLKTYFYLFMPSHLPRTLSGERFKINI